ncbi:MAG: aminopeptidase [Clostridia bacterium]|nr:aminopeptidase [Clostridia bacterium]
MKKTVLQKYARLIARKGANVQKGQDVIITADLDQPEFVKMVADECYRAGARKVRVDWSYQPLTKSTYRYASLKTLSTMEEWEIKRFEHYVDTLPARIYIDSSDPEGMAGVDQKKVAKAQQALYPIIKPLRDKMENKYQWCIAAVPGPKWAKKVFPNLRVSAAMEKLWETILYTARADGEDPVADWEAHNADLAKRCEYLNHIAPTELIYRSANGTDFTVGLIPEGSFLGGSEDTLGGVEFNPNIPSEEVFTSPKKGLAEGTVVATRPLSYRGQMIENFSLTFHEGKVVDCKAEKNEDLLRTMISMDENAAYLGECALVPYDSPIQNSGVTFFNTLFDENACCHLALGAGFENTIQDFGSKTLEECRELGINDSIIHVDFMIGSPDLSIDAKGKDGKLYPIFRDGNWAF